MQRPHGLAEGLDVDLVHGRTGLLGSGGRLVDGGREGLELGVDRGVEQLLEDALRLLVERLPRSLQRVADIIAYLATLAFVLYVMVFGGLQQSMLAWGQRNPLLPLTQGQLYLVLPISGALLTIYLTIHIVTTFSSRYVGHVGHPDEDLEAASL